MIMDCSLKIPTPNSLSPYELIFQAIKLIPISHFFIWFAIIISVFLYNFLEWHLIRDILSGFKGQAVTLTFNPDSKIYHGVVSKCKILHGRYLATPWLASPHIQTTFLNFFGRPPVFTYRRRIFLTPDGGTIALDWLLSSDVKGRGLYKDNDMSRDDRTPIVVVVPGLSSDSNAGYLKHLVYNSAKWGWNVVVSNHRGLGGVSVTSDCFYNAGWTEDVHHVIRHIHDEFPNAPLFLIGTSVGANVVVKYLGEHGEDIPIAGAVAVCSPWDILICDRFIGRRLVQRFYNRALTVGLQGYAKLHQHRLSRLVNWEGMEKSCSVREFDNHATRILGKYETVDTFYRRASSSNYVSKVSVPLLCISAMDDPVCTREAIPFDECRLNENIVLATAQHGGHLAFFEGITASSLWWVRAANEFLQVLHSSPYMHKQKLFGLHPTSEPSIDQGPYVNVAEDGMVAAMTTDSTRVEVVEGSSEVPMKKQDQLLKEAELDHISPVSQISEQSPEQVSVTDPTFPIIKQRLNQLCRQSRKSIWLLASIAIITSWPLLGSAVYFIFKRKMKKMLPSILQKG